MNTSQLTSQKENTLDRVGNISYVTLIEPSNAEPPIWRRVDVESLAEQLYLIWLEARKTEHAFLLCDMAPACRCRFVF